MYLFEEVRFVLYSTVTMAIMLFEQLFYLRNLSVALISGTECGILFVAKIYLNIKGNDSMLSRSGANAAGSVFHNVSDYVTVSVLFPKQKFC